MTKITYRIVEHDGGWAYRLDDVYSETFPTHDAALEAARSAAVEQEVESVSIESDRDAEKSPVARTVSGGSSEADVPDLGQNIPAGEDIAPAPDKVDLRMHANAVVDRGNAPHGEAINQAQEEIAENRADRKDDEVDEEELEDELDEGLRETFPASDPVAVSQTTRTGAPGEMAKKK